MDADSPEQLVGAVLLDVDVVEQQLDDLDAVQEVGELEGCGSAGVFGVAVRSRVEELLDARGVVEHAGYVEGIGKFHVCLVGCLVVDSVL